MTPGDDPNWKGDPDGFWAMTAPVWSNLSHCLHFFSDDLATVSTVDVRQGSWFGAIVIADCSCGFAQPRDRKINE
jgi:hypothetical protein